MLLATPQTLCLSAFNLAGVYLVLQDSAGCKAVGSLCEATSCSWIWGSGFRLTATLNSEPYTMHHTPL